MRPSWYFPHEEDNDKKNALLRDIEDLIADASYGGEPDISRVAERYFPGDDDVATSFRFALSVDVQTADRGSPDRQPAALMAGNGCSRNCAVTAASVPIREIPTLECLAIMN